MRMTKAQELQLAFKKVRAGSYKEKSLEVLFNAIVCGTLAVTYKLVSRPHREGHPNPGTKINFSVPCCLKATAHGHSQ